jgi:hypothetical protein
MTTEAISGYATQDEFYASRYQQGLRKIFGIDLTPAEIAAYLPKPDPERPTEGNRRVRKAHASSFATYLREHETWICPALLLRAPDIFDYEVIQTVGETDFGKLGIPRLARTDIRILDGQHRILGIHMALEDIAAELETERDSLATAKKNDSPAAAIKQHKEKIEELERQRKRLNTERISVQIVLEDSIPAFKQMFVDIAENALGISSSIRTRFDSRKIVNRCVEPVAKHALLEGRVDEEKDRIGASNPNLVGAKHVAEMVRTVTVGIDGRISRRQEDELREDALIERTNEFLDVLLEGFSHLAAVADGKTEPPDLRKTNLIGGTSMLRVIAGVYFELREEGWDDEDIADFFKKLSVQMDGPLSEKSVWVSEVPGEIFSPGALAPRSRRQDLRSLVDTIKAWAKKPPEWLDKPRAVKAVKAAA